MRFSVGNSSKHAWRLPSCEEIWALPLSQHTLPLLHQLLNQALMLLILTPTATDQSYHQFDQLVTTFPTPLIL